MVGGLSDYSISSWPWFGQKPTVRDLVRPVRVKARAKELDKNQFVVWCSLFLSYSFLLSIGKSKREFKFLGAVAPLYLTMYLSLSVCNTFFKITFNLHF